MISNPPTNNIFSDSIKDRFWNFINSRQGGQCWIWNGAISKSGYGQFNYDGITTYAHRLSWIMHYGHIKDNLWVLHKCDVKRCINPLHLYLGTSSDNMIDRSNRNPGYGRGCRYSKFSRADAEEIKQLYKEGSTYTLLGHKYSVDPKTIGNIINGVTNYFSEDRYAD